MLISGCGIACGACIYLKRNKCVGCFSENESAKNCSVYACLKEHKLSNCLECTVRPCKERFKAMSKCPVVYQWKK